MPRWLLLLTLACTLQAQSGNGLVGQWKFDEGIGTTAADSSGGGNHGSLLNGAGWIAGRIGSAANFDGSNDHVRVPNSASIAGLRNAITVAAWVYHASDQGGAWAPVASRQLGTAYFEHFSLGFGQGRYSWIVNTQEAGYSANPGGPAPVGQWIHLAGTYDGAQSKLYVNGVQHFTVAHSGAMAADTTPVIIAGNVNNASGNPNEMFAGRIDELQIYNRALNAAEVQALYTGGGIGNQPPTVNLTGPAPGSTYTAPATINLAATAGDSDGTITKVEFFQGSTKLGEDTSSPYTFTWNSAPEGNYSLTARATDNGGMTATSAVVAVVVNGTAPLKKVMPLGDSITDGFDIPGGYRIELWNKLVSQGLPPNFVGSQTNGPAALGDRNHEGHTGWFIQQIADQTNTWMSTYQPDVVLLKIGTNDMIHQMDVATAPNRLSSLIDRITDSVPNAHIIVASILPVANSASNPNVNNRVVAYNSTIPGIVSAKAAAGKKVTFVNMNSAVPLTDLPDGVHPNSAGYAKMADVWFNAVRGILAGN